jgi:hypothetical protein
MQTLRRLVRESPAVDREQLVSAESLDALPVMRVLRVDERQTQVWVIVGQHQVHRAPLRDLGHDRVELIDIRRKVAGTAGVAVFPVPHQERVHDRGDLLRFQALRVEHPVEDVRQIRPALELRQDFIHQLEMPQGTVETLPSAQAYELVHSLCHRVLSITGKIKW